MTAKEIAEKLNGLMGEYRKTAKDMFEVGVKDLFAKYPGIETVSFECYSKYFNDGDECPFRARTDNLTINGSTDWDRLPEDDNDIWKTEEEGINAFGEFLNAFDDDFYESTYDNHITITLTKDGVTISENSNHD